MNAILRADVNLSNWRTVPYSAWAFQNAAELVPTAIISGTREAEAPSPGLGAMAKLPVAGFSGARCSLAEFLAKSRTDNFVVMRGGKIVAEWNAPHSDPAKPHLVFSISKSMTGLLAGILVGRGLLSPGEAVGKYMPEAKGSAYEDVTVQQLLDMQVSINFDESYLDRSGAFDRYRRAMLWNPERPDEPTPDLKSFLCTLPKAAHVHGTQHAYRSPNADMAALVLERAAGERYPALMSSLLWKPMGAHGDAHITVDRKGNPRASGGISMTARDLARVGELVRKGGMSVVPAEWVAALWSGGDRAIWAAGDQCHTFPGGSYRNYWYETGTGALVGIGIHGQWLWIDPKTETVIARQSAEPDPVNDRVDQVVIAMLKTVAAAA